MKNTDFDVTVGKFKEMGKFDSKTIERDRSDVTDLFTSLRKSINVFRCGLFVYYSPIVQNRRLCYGMLNNIYPSLTKKHKVLEKTSYRRIQVFS